MRLLDVPLRPGATRPFGVSNGSRLARRRRMVGEDELERGSRGQAQPALALGAVTKSGAVHGIGRHEGIPLLMVLHELGGVLELPVVGQIERRVGGEPVALVLSPLSSGRVRSPVGVGTRRSSAFGVFMEP